MTSMCGGTVDNRVPELFLTRSLPSPSPYLLTMMLTCKSSFPTVYLLNWLTRKPVPATGPSQSGLQWPYSLSGPPPLTTVVQLGMSFTEFFTSSSVTSTTLQCSSSDGRGCSPFLVTQGCICEDQNGRGGQDTRQTDTLSTRDPRHSLSHHP